MATTYSGADIPTLMTFLEDVETGGGSQDVVLAVPVVALGFTGKVPVVVPTGLISPSVAPIEVLHRGGSAAFVVLVEV